MTESSLKMMKNAFYFKKGIKFGQLIEYNTKNISVKKSYTKCAGETIPRSLSKK